MKDGIKIVKNLGNRFFSMGKSMLEGIMSIAKQNDAARRNKDVTETASSIKASMKKPAVLTDQQLVTLNPLLDQKLKSLKSKQPSQQLSSTPKQKSQEQLRDEENRARHEQACKQNPFIPKDYDYLKTLCKPNADYPFKITDDRKVLGISLKKDDYKQGKYTVPSMYFGNKASKGCILDFGNAFAYMPYSFLPTAKAASGPSNMDLLDLLSRANLRVPQEPDAQVSPAKWSGAVTLSGTNQQMKQFVQQQLSGRKFRLYTSQPIVTETPQSATTATQSGWSSDAFNSFTSPRHTPRPKFGLSTTPPAQTLVNKKDERTAPSTLSFEDPQPPSPSTPRF